MCLCTINKTEAQQSCDTDLAKSPQVLQLHIDLLAYRHCEHYWVHEETAKRTFIDLLNRFPILFLISGLAFSVLQYCMSDQMLLSFVLWATPEWDPWQAPKVTQIAVCIAPVCCARDEALQSTTVTSQNATSVSKTSC